MPEFDSLNKKKKQVQAQIWLVSKHLPQIEAYAQDRTDTLKFSRHDFCSKVSHGDTVTQASCREKRGRDEVVSLERHRY